MIPPGRTIGIIGGGQLGRMSAMSARRMGYRVHVLDPTHDCPASHVADRHVVSGYDDLSAAREFAQNVDVVTFEFENVPAGTLRALETIRPVRPSPFVLETTRNRLSEKRFLQKHSFPVTPFREVSAPSQLPTLINELSGDCILKSADLGYDGKGQVRVNAGSDMDASWARMGRGIGILEQVVPFDREISVLVARNARGEVRTFDVAENRHARHILDVTVAPARIPVEVATHARELAVDIAQKLECVGVLAVEMFVVGGKVILVNELAPRPHNSFHFSYDACATSQFEQHARAVCDLPLGDTRAMSASAMANLLGDLWQKGEPDFAEALKDDRVKLHLYGKSQPSPGRKMGHLTALAGSIEEAERAVIEARSRLVR